MTGPAMRAASSHLALIAAVLLVSRGPLSYSAGSPALPANSVAREWGFVAAAGDPLVLATTFLLRHFGGNAGSSAAAISLLGALVAVVVAHGLWSEGRRWGTAARVLGWIFLVHSAARLLIALAWSLAAVLTALALFLTGTASVGRLVGQFAVFPLLICADGLVVWLARGVARPAPRPASRPAPRPGVPAGVRGSQA